MAAGLPSNYGSTDDLDYGAFNCGEVKCFAPANNVVDVDLNA